MVRSPENTSKRDPLLHLALAMGGSSGFIEDMEKQGQRELSESEVLPTRGLESCRELIESNGGSIGEPVKGDEIFTSVTLPTGWKIKPTEHAMWSDLLDANGNKRAAMFYKAAFYDRSASISPSRRFSISNYASDREDMVQSAVVDAKGEVVFATESLPKTKNYWEVQDVLESQLKAYLDTNYPDW